MFKDAQLEEKGINIDGGKLSDLKLADDVSLTTEDVKKYEASFKHREQRKA